MSGEGKGASEEALVRADEVCREIRPILAEMIERNDPAVENLSFDEIESNSAAAGDLVAKLLMLRALRAQPAASEAEIAEARREALSKADPNLAGERSPEELRMTRQRDRPRRLKTVRGEIRFSREYLHFPDLGVGVFPPPEAPGDTRGVDDAPGREASS